MGFFSDLKEDLSQAVNELMPGEAENTEEMPEAENILAAVDSQEMAVEETVDISVDAEKAQWDELLDRVDSIEIPADMDITGFDREAEAVEMPEETAKEDFIAEEDLSITEELPTEALSAEALPIEDVMQEEVKETMEVTEEIVKEEGKKMDVQLKTATDENAIITAGMTVTGDVSSEGSMEVIGTINGNITILGKLNVTGVITGNSKAAEIYADNAKINGEVASEGAVKIGQSSVVIGNIFAKSAVIAGAVKGDIDVHGPVILDTSAIVMGNIKSKAVQINNGAVIEGMCSQCYADVNPSSFFEEYKKEKNKGA